MRVALALLALLTIAVPAFAADPYAEVEALTQVKNRYTIGPWQGALVGGANCQLLNTETLTGVEFSISASRSNPSTTIQLGADFLHDPSLNRLQVQLDGGPAVQQSFSVHRFGLFYMPKEADLAALSKARFVTYIIGKAEAGKPLKVVGQVSFDMRGFGRAAKLFGDCIAGRDPGTYPNEPLEEGQPRSLRDAPGWEVIDLSFDGKPYERFASLKASGDYTLGVWVHNRAQYVLSLNSFKEMPGLKNLKAVQLTLDGKEKLAIPAIVQADGVLVPLSLAYVRKIAAARQIEIAGGAIQASFDVRAFGKAAQAIQLTD